MGRLLTGGPPVPSCTDSTSAQAPMDPRVLRPGTAEGEEIPSCCPPPHVLPETTVTHATSPWHIWGTHRLLLLFVWDPALLLPQGPLHRQLPPALSILPVASERPQPGL